MTNILLKFPFEVAFKLVSNVKISDSAFLKTEKIKNNFIYIHTLHFNADLKKKHTPETFSHTLHSDNET